MTAELFLPREFRAQNEAHCLAPLQDSRIRGNRVSAESQQVSKCESVGDVGDVSLGGEASHKQGGLLMKHNVTRIE